MSAADAGSALLLTALVVVLTAGILALNVGSLRTSQADERLRVVAFVVLALAAVLAISGFWTLAAAGSLR